MCYSARAHVSYMHACMHTCMELEREYQTIIAESARETEAEAEALAAEEMGVAIAATPGDGCAGSSSTSTSTSKEKLPRGRLVVRLVLIV